MPRHDPDHTDTHGQRRTVVYRPALRALALIALVVAAIAIDNWWVLLGLVVLPVLVWIVAGRNPLRLVTSLRRTWFFLAMLVVSFVLFPPQGEEVLVTIGGEQVNIAGLLFGVMMSLRILAIVLGSLVVRETGKPGELLIGLRQLGLPLAIGQTIEGTLVLLSGRDARPRGERRRSGGRSGPPTSGNGTEPSEDEPERRLSRFRALLAARPRLIPRLGSAFASSIQESTTTLQGLTTAAGQRQVSMDAVVITALTVMAMSIKFMKIMPGIPILSGHKQLVIIPLYFVAADLSKSRWAATWMGVSLGVVSFMFGEGRFGLLEIAKYVASGLALDLMWPVLRRRRSAVLFGLAGTLMGVAWLASTLPAAVIVRAPPVLYTVILITSISQLAFSLFSGPVSLGLLRAIDRTDIEMRGGETGEPPADTEVTPTLRSDRKSGSRHGGGR